MHLFSTYLFWGCKHLSIKKYLSLDIGSKYIHGVEGVNKAGQPEISNTLLASTPAGAINDGKLEDINLIREVLKNTLLEKRISSRNVIFVVQSTQIITRDFTIPFVKTNELGNAVQYEMEQYIPGSPERYHIEYRITDDFKDGDVRRLKIHAAAMPKEIVEGYFKLADELKMTPVALDIHSNAVYKLFCGQFSVNNKSYDQYGSYALLDIGYKTTSISIISGGKLEMNRIIAFGGREIDTAIAPFFNLTLDRAEQKKLGMRLNLDSDNYNDEDEPIKTILGQLTMELQKVLQFYSTRGNGKPVNDIFIFGGSSLLIGLDEYLKRNISVNVIKIDYLDSIKKICAMDPALLYYLNAAGALIRL